LLVGKTRAAVLAAATLTLATTVGVTAAPAAVVANVAHVAAAKAKTAHRCTTAQLGVSFRGADAGAGQRFLTLVLTNQGATCWTGGYPWLQFYGRFGHAIAANESHVPAPHSAIMVAPGGKVRSCLRWGAVSPPFVHPHVIGVTPPGALARLFVPWRWGAVFRGDISVTPLKSGTTCP